MVSRKAIARAAKDVAEVLRKHGVLVVEFFIHKDNTFEGIVGEIGGFVDGDDHGKRFAVVTGHGPRMTELSMLMAHGDDVGTPPQIMLFAREHYFSFLRSDVTSIAPYVDLWYKKNFVESGSAADGCVVCGNAHKYSTTCTQCCAKTCIECFPNIVHRSDEDGSNVFPCPICRHVRLAIDALRPKIDGEAVHMRVWDAMGDALMAMPGRRSGFIIANGHYAVIGDASVSTAGRVHLHSRYHKIARVFLGKPGTVIGLGDIPAVICPESARFKHDPNGCGFVVMTNGKVLRLVNGWEYAYGVFL
jgi:hypothetical protein